MRSTITKAAGGRKEKRNSVEGNTWAKTCKGENIRCIWDYRLVEDVYCAQRRLVMGKETRKECLCGSVG